ncbi:MAG: hypothetical protein HKN36_00205 [Hellea sp.]|nr:hypothetical protein [Hellea sp.]
MLLRRITKHVKDQNWFAVFLDFFIVVAGILIAFQINAWSDRQALHKAATSSLTMLLDDLNMDLQRLDVVAAAQTTRINAFRRATNALLEPQPDHEKIAVDINLGSDNNRTLLARDTVYDTMEKEGHMLALPSELRRKISTTYGYDFPALSTAGLQMDDNQDEVDSRCMDIYWDWDLGVPISEAAEDLARLRNCLANLRNYSSWYLGEAEGQYRQNADALKTALEAELGIEHTETQ